MRSCCITVPYLCFVATVFATYVFGTGKLENAVRNCGYPCEVHSVVTEDGYILTLHRIPHGRTGDRTAPGGAGEGRPPVIMQHGILSSSDAWVVNIPIKAPAYIMADAGYDVWLTNARGNLYCKNHTHLSPKSKAFWQFSWDEMGYYDVPASIDYILGVTKYEQLYYIGYSMGSTTFFAGMSRRPEYNKKIKAMFALAPIATFSHIKGPARIICNLSGYLKEQMEENGEYELMGKNTPGSRNFRWLCGLFKVSRVVCENFLFLFVGYDDKEINEEWIPAIEDGITSGTSLYTALHYCQEYFSGKFQLYDYGADENLHKYGKKSAPVYDAAKVTAPVHLLWGENDYLANYDDVKFLIRKLPNLQSKRAIPYKNFNHLDFLIARDIRTMVYNPILEKMKTSN